MANISAHRTYVSFDQDFYHTWLAISPSLTFPRVYYWSGMQDKTIGQIDGQPAGTVRWGAYGCGFYVASGTNVPVIIELTSEGLGAPSSYITGISGIAQLSSSMNVPPQFTPL